MPATAADTAGTIRPIVNVVAMPDGVTQRQVQTIKVADGFGGWRLSWVPPVRSATVGFSKTGVNSGEAYDVTLTVPGGTPEGARVEFTVGDYKQSYYPVRGTTVVTLPGAASTADGAHKWTVNVYTAGGDTSFTGTQTVNGRSTATVTGKAWIMSYLSGEGDVVAAPQDFTFTLSNRAAVSKVVLEATPWLDPPPWKVIGVWTPQVPGGPVGTGVDGWAAIPGDEWDWAFASTMFDSLGMWSVRLKVTHLDGHVYESPHFAFEVRKKVLLASASTTTPYFNDPVTLTPSCGVPCDTPYKFAQWEARWDASGWHNHDAQNVHESVWTDAWGNVDFRWTETYEDGTKVASKIVEIRPINKPPPSSPYHVRAGMGQAEIQAIVHSRAGQQVLVEPATYQFTSGKFYIPDGVHLVANGSTFIVHQGIVNAGSGGNYDRAGGWTWEGGTFDGMGIRTTMFSIAHARSFTIRGVRVRGCAPKGHGIEINSSGGPVQTGYTVVIDGCAFDGVMGHRSGEGSYDEAIHIDYAWGSGAATANPENDGTVCNNVVVQNCHVEHTYPHNPTGYPVAFGSHKFSISTASHPDSKKSSAGNWIARPPTGPNTLGSANGQARPKEYHRHILAHYNTFRVSAYSGTEKRGAIHMRGWDGVVVGANHALSSPSGKAPVTDDSEYTKNISSSPAAVNI